MAEIAGHAAVFQRAAADILRLPACYVDGLSRSLLAHIGAGSVIGEQSFFDSQPRLLNVWAVSDGRTAVSGMGKV
jgi:CRP-like cAMP-binding protein